VKIIYRALGTAQNFAAAAPAVIGGTLTDVVGLNKIGINLPGISRNSPAVEFRQQNVCEAAVGLSRHIAADLADPDKDPAVTDAYSMIDADVRVEFHDDLGHSSGLVIKGKGLLIEVIDSGEVYGCRHVYQS